MSRWHPKVVLRLSTGRAGAPTFRPATRLSMAAEQSRTRAGSQERDHDARLRRDLRCSRRDARLMYALERRGPRFVLAFACG